MRKKIIDILILSFAVFVSANNSQYEWVDENGCMYCLYGYFDDGKCVHVNRKNYFRHDLEISKLNNDFFSVDYDFRSSLHVYCKSSADYCKTIVDPMVVKLMPSLKDRKSYCKEQRKKRQNTGMFFSIPIHGDDVKFLCDFVEFNYRKSYLKVLGYGTCPVRVKGPITPSGRIVYVFYNLYITKQKIYEIKKEKIFSQTHEGKYIKKNDFFTIGDCSNSNCDILNYIEEQPQDFNVKCDFIKKKAGQIGKVQVLGIGVCPIEIIDKDNRKQVYYVRSVKEGDEYKLLITNKRK